MKITRGKKPHAYKVVIYGPEGVGKTTLASKFPDPLFIDTESGSLEYDIQRFDDVPSSWAMLMEQVDYVLYHPDVCKTLVIDTADWAERLCITHVCNGSSIKEDGLEGIEKFGYGKGYRYVTDEFGRLINKLSEVTEKGIHVVVTAHAAMRKFEQPDETGAYDRWEMKLIDTPKCSISALLKEWADCVFFASYKTNTVSVSDDGKKKKAVGRGQRVIRTTHHSCWDAKNRFGLPEELPMDYSSIAHIFDKSVTNNQKTSKKKTETNKKSPKPALKESEPLMVADAEQTEIPWPEEEKKDPPKKKPEPAPQPQEPPAAKSRDEPDPRIPKALRDLMIANDVHEMDIQNVVGQKGYYPSDTPISNYDPGFIQGVLVGAWKDVFKMIEAERNQATPFD